MQPILIANTNTKKREQNHQSLAMPVIQPLAGSYTAPQQHKQPSRKGRKAWRKNVDVSEVERGLEERNDEIIKG